MRFFLFFILLFLLPIDSILAQDPLKPGIETASDTIEGQSTDTSIVYIIKKAPVTIKEKVEIERSKKKYFFFSSIGVGTFFYSNTYHAREDADKTYVRNLNEATSPLPGFSTFVHLYHIPKKTIFGISIDGRRMNERFSLSEKTSLKNSYTYGGAGIIIGKWYRKERTLSYQFMAISMVDHKFGVSGYAINETDSSTTYIAESLHYKKYNINFIVRFKLLYRTKNSFVELSPYIVLSPFSMTNKQDIFSINRNMAGISLSLTNKLF